MNDNAREPCTDIMQRFQFKTVDSWIHVTCVTCFTASCNSLDARRKTERKLGYSHRDMIHILLNTWGEMPTAQPGESVPKAVTGLHGDTSLAQEQPWYSTVVWRFINLFTVSFRWGDQSPKNDSVIKKWCGWLNLDYLITHFHLQVDSMCPWNGTFSGFW